MLRKIYPVALVIGMLIGGFSIRASAQNDDIVLTLIVAQFQEEIFTDELLGEFQAANPGVKVIVKTAGNNGFFAPASVDSEGHLDEIETYVTSGDVLLMNSFGLSVEATRAGYFLDLSPLVNADPSLNSTDFYPAVWQSVQWDNGIWAIPAGVDVYVISYDPAAFDEAGLAYPDPAWTMDDYINAIKTLTEYDDSGAVTRPGFISNFEAGFNYLLRGFLGTGVYDPAALPGMPDFSSPQLESLLQTWYDEIDKEGVTDFTGSFDFNEIPIRVDRSFGLASFNAEDVRAGALLPGGIAGLNVDSFAVSSGTAYPEQAYALAKWLTTRPEFTQRLFGARPARQSMVGMESSGGGGPQVFRNFTPEIEALIDEALIHAIPVSDMRFMDYVIRAMDTMGENGGDARSALQEMEQTAITNLQTAEQRNQDTTVFVATPVPTPVLSGNEVAINFGYTSFVSPLPNQDEWDRVIAEFVASDPEVGFVNFDAAATPQTQEMAENYDCFYLPFNAAQSSDTAYLLNLDPFIDADPTFDKSDVVSGVLERMQQDNKIWGMPLTVQIQLMRYHYQQFVDNGAFPPQNGWTIDEFNAALRALKLTSDDQAPFEPRTFGSGYLQILMAAYGGLPLDYRTDPITINFTDPATVDAIRQVLDLAKGGYIAYQELASFGGNRIAIGADEPIAIYDETLNSFGFAVQIGGGGGGGGGGEDPYRMTTYPLGNQYSAVSYDVGAAYISASTPLADACYRWLSYLSQSPSLFDTMPARRSQITNPDFVASQPPDAVSYYTRVDALLADPNTITIPASGRALESPDGFLMQFWLGRAFDRYVLEDADLEAELVEAEGIVRAYQECAAGLPPIDPSQFESPIEAFQEYIDCATKVDPTLGALFAAN